jgi:hypothetical protein
MVVSVRTRQLGWTAPVVLSFVTTFSRDRRRAVLK